MQPLVSIITPCYNSADFITKTLDSVIEQTHKNWELLIIDDKSKDKTCEVVESFMLKHANIRLVKLAENGGVANARNVGLDEAKGKYVAFLDSDDIWLNEKLAIQVAYMETNELEMTFCAYKRINEAGDIISRKIQVPFSVNYNQLLYHNVIIFTTSMVLRNTIGDLKFKKVGHEDWVFWLDIFKKSVKGYGINEQLALYRIRKGSVSNNKLRAAGFTWKLLRESQKIGLLKSTYYFSRYAITTVVKYLK